MSPRRGISKNSRGYGYGFQHVLGSPHLIGCLGQWLSWVELMRTPLPLRRSGGRRLALDAQSDGSRAQEVGRHLGQKSLIVQGGRRWVAHRPRARRSRRTTRKKAKPAHESTESLTHCYCKRSGIGGNLGVRNRNHIESCYTALGIMLHRNLSIAKFCKAMFREQFLR